LVIPSKMVKGRGRLSGVSGLNCCVSVTSFIKEKWLSSNDVIYVLIIHNSNVYTLVCNHNPPAIINAPNYTFQLSG